jgi:hypothetical protein
MSSAFASALAVLVMLAGCEHHLDLSLALATDSCNVTVPAGGSIFYETTSGGPADAGARSSCGGCLPVSQSLAGPDAITAFLRAYAPACSGVAAGSSLVVRLTGFAAAACPDPPAPRLFCSASSPVTLPDGHDDAVAVVVLTCNTACAGACMPTSCTALKKNCGMLDDGCGGMLDCGMCTAPEKCGRYVPNVCDRP